MPAIGGLLVGLLVYYFAREGPIVQIGSAWGSALGQFMGVGENNLKMLVACGAAAESRAHSMLQ